MDDGIFKVRASSWGSLFDCAYRWEGEHLMGIRKPSSLRAHLGTAIHAGTAAFDAARLTGERITPDEAAGAFVDSLKNPDREVDWRDSTLTVSDAERIGLSLTTRYCTELAPHFEFTAVEMPLLPLTIDCGGGVKIKLTGSMDRARVARAAGGVVIPDVKTGSRVIAGGEVSIKGRAPQLGTYQLLYEHTTREQTVGGQIIGLQTTKKADVGVSPIFDAKKVMVGTEEAPGLIEIGAQMFRSGLFPPNPSSPICSEKYCARWAQCPYHE